MTMTSRYGLAGLVICLTGCTGGGPSLPPGPPQPPDVVFGSVTERDRSGKADGAQFNQLVAAQNGLAVRMLAAMREANPDSNVAVGSYSIHQVLGMVYGGARGNTAEDMKRVLGWDMPSEAFHATMNALDLELLSRGTDVTLAIANRTWAQKGLPLVPAFLDVLTRHYGAPLAVADFQNASEEARAAINGWVKSATGEKIAELFPAGTINGKTRLVLANAMYLDAPWKYKFNPQRTTKRPFTFVDGTRADVETMHYDEFLPSAWGEGWRAVELPYRGDELAMLVIVPQDLRDFEARLTPAALGEIAAKVKHGGIHLSMPKLKFSFHASLVKALQQLGLGSLFDGADFSGITGSPDLAVAEVEHEVFLEVDEEGTTAAAATGASFAGSHGPTIQVDRPFLFLIRDRPTGAILFIGRVLDPR